MLPEHQTETTYNTVRGYVVKAQRQIYSAVNSAMVVAYWSIGKTSNIVNYKLQIERMFIWQERKRTLPFVPPQLNT